MAQILDMVNPPLILEAIGPPSFPLLKRIIGGLDDDVFHSLVFEFVDGERRGLCLDEKNEVLCIMDDSNIHRRIGVDWIDIDYGDYIVSISGFNSNRSQFLCHSVTLLFQSGLQVTFNSKKKTLRGDPFNYNIPPTKLVTNLVFLTNGTMPAVGVNTTSIHLPISKENMSLLPQPYERRVFRLFMIFNKICLEYEGKKGVSKLLPCEVGWKIVSYLGAHHLKE